MEDKLSQLTNLTNADNVSSQKSKKVIRLEDKIKLYRENHPINIGTFIDVPRKPVK